MMFSDAIVMRHTWIKLPRLKIGEGGRVRKAIPQKQILTWYLIQNVSHNIYVDQRWRTIVNKYTNRSIKLGSHKLYYLKIIYY